MGLVAVFYLVRYLQSRSPKHLAISAIAVAASLFTHNLVGGLMVGALMVAPIHWLYLTRASRREWIGRLGDAATLVLPAGLFTLVSAILSGNSGSQPSLNPNELTWIESIEHTIAEAPIPWLLLTGMALALGLWRRWSGPNAVTVAVGGSWLVVSLLFFAVIGEPRALLLTQLGVVLIAVPGYAELLRVAEDRNVYARDALVVLGAILVFATVASGYQDYDAATDYYRVVDNPEVAALDHLMEVSQPGDLVVASAGHHENHMGWWIQGYAERPTLPGGNVAFLASPQERAQGALANRVFQAAPAAVAGVLRQMGARFMVIDRRGPNAVWLDSPEFAASFDVVDDSSNLVVVRLSETG
jgi:hypothetical protein